MIIKKILSFLPSQEVGDGRGSTFFVRYTLLWTPLFRVYLHRFLRSDHDRCLHDHPWWFIAVILRGGYWEHVGKPPSHFGLPADDVQFLKETKLSGHAALSRIQENLREHSLCFIDRMWRRPGSILFRRATFAHRIEIEPGTNPWSLVIAGRKSRAWGFFTRDGWKPWEKGLSPICEDAT